MKYLSVLFFAVALVWTWNTIHSKPNIDSETHSGIQAAMARLVRSSVLSKKPQAQNFVIQKMRTEEQEGGEVKVYFQYSFAEPDSEGHMVTSKISGIASLLKAASSEENEQWQLKKVQATSDVIEFAQGLTITPGGDEGGETPAPEAQAAPAAPAPPASEHK